MRRGTLLAVSIALAFAASHGAAGDADEWERPFDGVLPEPEESVSVNLPEEGVETPVPRAAAWIVDGSTGAPVPGATLTLFAEDVSFGVASYTTPVGAGTADAGGVAWLDASSWTGAGHWIAEASGYAPLHEYGRRPPPRMALAHGTDVTVRLLDPMGRPAAGIDVDAYLGCEHSGTVRRARSAKDGTFTLKCVTPDDTQLWIASRTGCLGFGQELGRLGRRASDVQLETSASARGRFVDAAGKPVAGVVVRALDFNRAPVAVSDADGRFELVGFPLFKGLSGFAPGAANAFVIDHRELSPVPRTITLGADGQPVEPEDDAAISLQFETPEGAGVPKLRVRLTRLSDGATFEFRAADDDEDEPSGSVSADVPPGEYEVAPAGVFMDATFPAFRWRVARDAVNERKVVATAQPGLAVNGRLPPDAIAVLAAAGSEWERSMDFDEWAPHVPDGPAVLSVQPVRGQRAVFSFPVGPEKDGVRTADVVLPAPHRVRIAGAAKLRVERLSCDGFEVAHVAGGAVLATYAEGPMVLDAKVDGVVRRFAFDLPPKEEGDVVLDPAAAPVVAPGGIVRVVTEGKGARVRVEGSNVSISGGTSAESAPPCRVVITRPGYQPFDRTFTQPAEVRHAWGACSLHLTVRDESGAAAPSIVRVDGVTHWTDGGALDLAGLASGPHDVAVSPVRGDLVGRELRIVLSEDESRTREVVLPKR